MFKYGLFLHVYVCGLWICWHDVESLCVVLNSLGLGLNWCQILSSLFKNCDPHETHARPPIHPFMPCHSDIRGGVLGGMLMLGWRCCWWQLFRAPRSQPQFLCTPDDRRMECGVTQLFLDGATWNTPTADSLRINRSFCQAVLSGKFELAHFYKRQILFSWLWKLHWL